MSREIATAYVDSNIFSVLYYRGGDVTMLHQQLDTWLWWDSERQWFTLYGSSFIEQELSAGRYPNQEKALAAARRTTYVPLSEAMRECAQIRMRPLIAAQVPLLAPLPIAQPGTAVEPAITVRLHKGRAVIDGLHCR